MGSKSDGREVTRRTDLNAGHHKGVRRIVALGAAGLFAGALVTAPVGTAAKARPSSVLANARQEQRRVSYRQVDRAEVENLQRWVSAGHADWCKDARLVAAEELWRVAPEFSGDGFELAESVDESGNRVTFEWAPLDGSATYRVTVERFEWLLPIVKSWDGVVWVPTRTEVRRDGAA